MLFSGLRMQDMESSVILFGDAASTPDFGYMELASYRSELAASLKSTGRSESCQTQILVPRLEKRPT